MLYDGNGTTFSPTNGGRDDMPYTETSGEGMRLLYDDIRYFEVYSMQKNMLQIKSGV